MDISEMPLQATVRLRLESKKCFFSWNYSYFVCTRSLKFSAMKFFFLFTKKLFLHTEMNFLTYCENNFCRLSFLLLIVSLTGALKYQKKKKIDILFEY